MQIDIRQAAMGDVGGVAALALLLWPEHAPDGLSLEMAKALCGPESAVFLAEADGKAVAFAQCALRHDYVEGTSTRPVGYLEGIYVLAPYRRAGVATRLTRACEAWAKGHKCAEFASDCLLHNTDSIAFHLGAGFTEANRLVCFVKKLP